MEIKQVFPTLKKHLNVDGYSNMVVDLDRCHGSYLFDSLHQRKVLDFFSYFASAPIAYNHPAMQDRVFQQKLLRAAMHNPTNSDIYTVEFAEFMEVFERVLMPPEFVYAFFVAGGTLAVENAIKAAIDWKVRKNIRTGRTSPEDDQLQKLGTKVLHFDEAFHGRSGYALSMTNTADPNKFKYFPKFDWPRLPNPKLSFPLTEEVRHQVHRRELFTLELMHRIVQQHPFDIAALIIEPIQGEGGDNHFSPAFLARLREFTLQHEIMLIFDEVQSGVGLTGKTWAYQHYDVVPDMLCFGKKTQVCGFMSTKRIDEIPDNVFHASSRINSTWGGNLVDMVRCQRYLEIIEREDLINRAAQMGQLLADGLLEVAADTGVVSNIRGRGLMVAFDLPDPMFRNKAYSKMLEHNVLVLKSGTHSIRLRPHLDVTEDEVRHGLAALTQVLLSVKRHESQDEKHHSVAQQGNSNDTV